MTRSRGLLWGMIAAISLLQVVESHAEDDSVPIVTEGDIPGAFWRVHLKRALLSREQCERAVREAEDHARENGWNLEGHHDNYPTTDLAVHQVPALRGWMADLMVETVLPLLAKQFDRPRLGLSVQDLFVVRYEVDHQPDLPMHRDGSEISFVISLNELSNYEGGGTFFGLDNETHLVEQGSMLSFRGSTMWHGARAVTQGTRYVLAGFVNVANLWEGHHTDMITSSAETVGLFPGNDNVYFDSGYDMTGLKDFPSALDSFTRAFSVHTGHGNAYFNSALASKHSGNPEGAMAHFTRSSFANPAHAPTYFSSGNTVREEDPDDARKPVQLYTRATVAQPTFAGGYHNSAILVTGLLQSYQERLAEVDPSASAQDKHAGLKQYAVSTMQRVIHLKKSEAEETTTEKSRVQEPVVKDSAANSELKTEL